MVNDTSPENTPTGSTSEHWTRPVVCFDPDNHDKPCPICGGLGVFTPDVPVDDPQFGKFQRCPNNPVEQDHERQKRLRQLSDMDAFADKSFDNFEVDNPLYTTADNSTLYRARSASMQYADDPQGWLLLEGTYGCGKTHLAAAIANYRLERGDLVMFVTVPDLLDYLRSAYSPSADVTYDQLFDRVREAQMLILDDLGVENPSPWAQEKLFQLLNYRYTRKKPTILTTNTDIDQLDPRLRSRLMDVNIVNRLSITAPDYRNAMKKRQQATSSVDDFARYADMTFENFELDHKLLPTEHRNLEKAYHGAISYAQQPQGWLALTGPYGSGKTHLAAAITHYRRSVGDQAIFMTVPDLLDYLRATFHPDSRVKFDGRFREIRDAPFLVLDDLSMASASPWAKEKLFQILDHRFLTKKPTVLTTSQHIEEIDERIRSRLLDRRRCAIFAIIAPGYWKRKR